MSRLSPGLECAEINPKAANIQQAVFYLPLCEPAFDLRLDSSLAALGMVASTHYDVSIVLSLYTACSRCFAAHEHLHFFQRLMHVETM